MSFCFFPTICFYSEFSGCPGKGNFPILSSWNTRREDELVPTQEAQRCQGSAVNRPAFVVLPAVRLMVSASGSPKNRGHIACYSSHTLDNLIHPLRFLYGPSAVFPSSPDSLPERFTELRLLGQGCGFRLVPLFAWGSCIIPCMAWGQSRKLS